MRLLSVAAAAVTLLITAGCGGSDDSQEPSTPAPPEKVTYLTGVNIQGREAYVYVAMDKGFFHEAGFDVEVTPGNGTTQNLQILQGGSADFAIVDISAALIEFGKGTFKDFTIVSAIQQRSLACLMALEGAGVAGPKDLEGKKIAYIPGGVVKLLFDTYARLAGVDSAKVTWVNMPAQQMGQGLAAGTIDVATQFVVGQPAIEATANGRKAVVLPFSDYLADLYGNGLAVSRQSLQENPDRVRRFNQAMLKGLAYAIEHPDEAGAIYAKYQKLQPEKVATAETSLMAPYVHTDPEAPVGAIDEQQIARNIAILQGAGIIPPGVSPRDVVSFDMVSKD